jgi:hypothetical protein
MQTPRNVYLQLVHVEAHTYTRMHRQTDPGAHEYICYPDNAFTDPHCPQPTFSELTDAHNMLPCRALISIWGTQTQRLGLQRGLTQEEAVTPKQRKKKDM